uniref:Inter-alpha-trypsin inhibitor heavy chain 5 n=1 Tax=Electrophorus electricus TaxID=8005 RepID=A0A4W4G7P3_ELEEL
NFPRTGNCLGGSLYANIKSNPMQNILQCKLLLYFFQETKPHIQELSIQTTIMSRYAFTAVSCTMLNRYSAATEGVFQLQVPAAAFISNFTMIVGGRVFPSQIKVKKKNGDKNRDENNGRMKSKKSGEAETFRMAITVPGRNRAVFLLTYEELLVRRLGYYEHVTSVRPMHLVSRLNVGVTIVEHSRIKYLDVLPLRNAFPFSGKATMPVSTVVRQNETFCKISFTPNIVQQVKITNNGILGDFVVRYDVEREMGIGDIQVLDGHFVHYFAPKDLPIVPKNVVFVIDTSASMVGTKIRQTKEALFTILRDLRPNDRFNFVTFSSRIRVWQPGKLVPVTPNNVRDAKKFIYMISPTGGTDINRGIQAGSLLLSEYLSSQEHTNGNSVSLIIFLTDGRPTVGVIQTPSILGNTKTAVKEKFCIFTIGMGKDVDYRLLERMALENCGTMRRIPEEADTSTMLKGFYDEIGTPLLSDIRMEYSDDAVEYVTRNHFPNYFNGSEIVVAGRLHNRSANALHVQVTASNSEHSLTMETDVSLGERERQTRRRVKEAEAEAGVGADGYVERLWGFLSVKEGLKGRLRSHGGAERENFTRRAADLSLAYNFLTPLTQMLVETPQVLADGTVARAEPAGGPPPDDSADGDPHFVVEFPHNKLNVCFNINGEAGDILRLVTDHKHSGVTVNGKLIGTPAPSGSHKQQRTYFGSITVVVDMPRRSYIEVTPHKVILDSRDRMVLPCSSSISVESESLSVNIAANASVTVTIQASIQFVILLHGYKNPAPYQQDHLGFYIANKKGLSKDTHGLLGQFLYEEVALIQLHGNITVATGNDMGGAGLKVKKRTVEVVKKTRRIYSGTHTVDCWFAKNNAAHLIDGQYQDYVVPHQFDTGHWPHGNNIRIDSFELNN